MGIDPAEVSPVVLEHPNFRHVRRRTTQVRRREFRRIRWLTADMNVAPQYTLEAVESIVMDPEVRIRGMLLTLKLLDWSLAERIPEYARRVRRWGFNHVWTRQLAHHRQEFCLAALKKPFKH
jgi:23S rRNA (cytidine2498-2'-O)-methyltransferase